MNEIAYKLLIDKSIKRKVYILSLLLESPTPLSFVELEDLCNVSIKTLQQDISFLLQQLPKNLKKIVRNKQNAIESIGEKSHIIEFINSLVEDNPLFLIIKDIFEGKQHNLLTLSEELFITEATLRKYLSVLKNVLKEYNLNLVTTPLEIIGDEVNVRYFYFQYFRHAHKSAQLEIPKELDSFLNNTIIKLEKNKTNLNLDYHQLIHWFAVINMRRQLGKLVHLEDSLMEKYAKKNGFNNNRFILKKLFNEHNLSYLEKPNEQEMLYSYILIFSCIFYDSDNGGYFFTDDSYNDLSDFEELVHLFFIQSEFIFCLNMEFNIIVKAFLTNLKLLNDLSPLFQKVSSQLKRIAEEKYPEILKNWFYLLKEKTDFTYPYDIATSLTLLTASKARKHKRILFCFTGESSSLSYLKVQALRTVPKEMEVFFYFNHSLDDLLLEKAAIDICVVNFEPINKLVFSQIVKLSAFPLENEWTELLLMLHSV